MDAWLSGPTDKVRPWASVAQTENKTVRSFLVCGVEKGFTREASHDTLMLVLCVCCQHMLWCRA